MAKQAAIPAALLVDGVVLSGDVREVMMRNSSTPIDVTAIAATGGIERIHGLADGEISIVTHFNKAAAQEHLTLRAKGSDADRAVLFYEGSAVGNMAAGIVAKQINYDPSRAADGSLTSAIQCLSDGSGLEYCELLTAGQQTDASATASAGFQAIEGDATAFGLAAYIQVISLGSGTPTVKLQQSSDDGGSDAYADITGGTFGVVAAGTGARIVTAVQSVEEYVKVVTTGTFTDLVFVVAMTRYPIR